MKDSFLFFLKELFWIVYYFDLLIAMCAGIFINLTTTCYWINKALFTQNNNKKEKWNKTKPSTTKTEYIKLVAVSCWIVGMQKCFCACWKLFFRRAIQIECLCSFCRNSIIHSHRHNGTKKYRLNMSMESRIMPTD